MKAHFGVSLDLKTGKLSGDRVRETFRTLGDMEGYYLDERARQSLNPKTVVYRVQISEAAQDGQEGGLLLGTTFVEPGLVGDEYFMTKGHFHHIRNRSEYYITVAGTGALILMDENRHTTFEPMNPGSVHYIPFSAAHRVANTGDGVLAFLACWPSDAGHDYETIERHGFSGRLRKIGDKPALIEEP